MFTGHQIARFAALASTLYLLFFAPLSHATLIEAIAALDPGDQYRVVFTTSTTLQPESSHIEDYDDIVQSVADGGALTAPLGLSWQVVGSTSDVDAIDHLSATGTSTVHIFRIDGVQIAESYPDFFQQGAGILFNIDENGDQVFGRVATGTFSGILGGDDNGRASPNPLRGSSITWGFSNVPFEALDSGVVNTSALDYRLYSMSEVVSVPEPGTLMLSLLCLAGLFVSLSVRKTRAASER